MGDLVLLHFVHLSIRLTFIFENRIPAYSKISLAGERVAGLEFAKKSLTKIRWSPCWYYLALLRRLSVADELYDGRSKKSLHLCDPGR